MGDSISQLRSEGLLPQHGDGNARGISVKEAVLPWNRFRRTDGTGVDAILGPEMRSTGEVMGIANTFGESYSKSQTSALWFASPKRAKYLSHLANKDKAQGLEPTRGLLALGFTVIATAGTARYFQVNGIPTATVRKNSQGPGLFGESTAVDLISSGRVDLVINTPVDVARDKMVG